MLNDWLENEPKVTLVCAVASALSLVASITGLLANALPFDIAWIAIVACGAPILVGAFRGVLFDHDIKVDLLVSLALIASVAAREYFAAGEVALIMQIGRGRYRDECRGSGGHPAARQGGPLPDSKELSSDELEAVSGGVTERDWIKDGCAATVEDGSKC